MVLQSCELCTSYWLNNGRNVYGYRFLSRDQHIPEVKHPKDERIPIGAKASPCLKSADFLPQTASGPNEDIKSGAGDDKDKVKPELEEFNCANFWSMPVDRNNVAESNFEKERSLDLESEDYDPLFRDDSDSEKEDTWCFKLYKAAIDGDWGIGKSILDSYGKSALRAGIRGDSETALHVAVGNGLKSIMFVQNLLQYMSEEDVEMKNSDGCTSLANAAKVGNLEAAKLLTTKHQKLLYIPDKKKKFPIHHAAEHGHKEVLRYLLRKTINKKDPDPYDLKDSGPELLRLIIQAEFYDEALSLLKRVPSLSTSGNDSYLALDILADNPNAFSCWRNEGVFLPFIYACVPKPPHIKQSYWHTSDIENPQSEEYSSNKSHFYRQICKYLVSGLRMIHHVIWTIFEHQVPLLNHIKHEKWKGFYANKLVKLLCKEAANKFKKSSKAALLFKFPLLKAAENGIHVIVKEIMKSFPDASWYKDDDHSGIFRYAIENRHPEVYNLLHDMGDHYINVVRQSEDDDGKNILHLAGDLAPPDRLGIVSGAALQLQRELQWFEEIESLVQASYKIKRYYGETPRELFTRDHSELRKDGERWMRDTATSCTVVATLIATIVFAAAITVPGGNSGENGKPMFHSEKAFIIFGVADALSLFASCISLLMFLSILTSRYALDDFLKSLPTRLIIGLLALFISVASMMVAFSATLYLMFGYRRRWILGCIIGPSCLIVATFASMHLLLLSQMIKSTYGRGIFRKRKTHGHRKFNLRWPFGSNK